jgi:hypothetical protein
MKTYIINWFIEGGDYAFKSYEEAKEYAESIRERLAGVPKVSLHYNIVELQNAYREDGETFRE